MDIFENLKVIDARGICTTDKIPTLEELVKTDGFNIILCGHQIRMVYVRTEMIDGEEIRYSTMHIIDPALFNAHKETRVNASFKGIMVDRILQAKLDHDRKEEFFAALFSRDVEDEEEESVKPNAKN